MRNIRNLRGFQMYYNFKLDPYNNDLAMSGQKTDFISRKADNFKR